MDSPSTNVKIREATMEDYKDLQEIGDVYEGRDYLFSFYESFISDPDIYPLVAVVDDKVVGFYAIHRLDGGQTVSLRAGRVHPKFRGQGIFHRLADELYAYARRAWPNVKYQRVCVSDTVDRVAQDFLDKGYVEILKKADLNLTFDVKNLKSLDRREDVSCVRKMTTEDFKLLFKNDDVVLKFFPERILFNFFLGYRVMEENIHYLINDKTDEMYASVAVSSSPSVFQKFKNSGFDDSVMEYIDLISCSRHHQAHIGLVYTIHIYFCETYDESSLELHVKQHLETMRRLTDGGGVLIVFFPRGKEEIIFSSLKAHGISDLHPAHEKGATLYERNLSF